MMLGSKIRQWVESHFSRGKKRRGKEKNKGSQNDKPKSPSLSHQGPQYSPQIVLPSGKLSCHSDGLIGKSSQRPDVAGPFQNIRLVKTRAGHSGYSLMKHSSSNQLSSPESAYSTAHSEDGVSPHAPFMVHGAALMPPQSHDPFPHLPNKSFSPSLYRLTYGRFNSMEEVEDSGSHPGSEHSLQSGVSSGGFKASLGKCVTPEETKRTHGCRSGLTSPSPGDIQDCTNSPRQRTKIRTNPWVVSSPAKVNPLSTPPSRQSPSPLIHTRKQMTMSPSPSPRVSSIFSESSVSPRSSSLSSLGLRTTWDSLTSTDSRDRSSYTESDPEAPTRALSRLDSRLVRPHTSSPKSRSSQGYQCSSRKETCRAKRYQKSIVRLGSGRSDPRHYSSPSSSEEGTLNEMGRFEESYVYDKETDILSDSDATDCDVDLLGSGDLLRLDKSCESVVEEETDFEFIDGSSAPENFQKGSTPSRNLSLSGLRNVRLVDTILSPIQEVDYRQSLERLNSPSGKTTPGSTEDFGDVPFSVKLLSRLSENERFVESQVLSDREANEKYRQLILDTEQLLESLGRQEGTPTSRSSNLSDAIQELRNIPFSSQLMSPLSDTGATFGDDSPREHRTMLTSSECSDDVTTPDSECFADNESNVPQYADIPKRSKFKNYNLAFGEPIAHSSPRSAHSIKTSSWLPPLSPPRRTPTDPSWELMSRLEHPYRGSLEERVQELLREHLSVERKFEEVSKIVKQTHQSQRNDPMDKLERQLCLYRRQMLLKTLEGLKENLKEQSSALEDVYKDSISTQVQVRRQRSIIQSKRKPDRPEGPA